MVTIATWALGGSYDVAASVSSHLDGIAEAAASGADLVVFPEASLQGYPPVLARGSEQDLIRSAYQTAETLDGRNVAQLTRAALDRGIHVIFGMTERGPQPGVLLSVEHYLLYGRARATENALWFISANLTGTLGGRTFFGHSQIIDPLGRVIADTGSKPEPRLVLADIDVHSGIEAAYAYAQGP